VFDDAFAGAAPVAPHIRHLFFVMNLGVSSAVVFIFASYFAQDARKERARAEALQADLDEAAGKKLGAYTLEAKLGQGGMGIVYRARHALLRRSTAIKLLSSAENSDLDRFEREVQLTSELSHPNIIAVYDYGRSEEGEFYYAMEHVPGIDLESLVRDRGPIEPARAVAILMQIADALEAAHGHGLVHRDIKPANIMISRFGHRTDVVKVLDFGLVREVERAKNITKENVVCGTPAYIAPEALTDPDEVGPAGDLYALGAVAYFLLVGRLVFNAPSVPALYAHTLATAPKPPSKDSPFTIPEALDAAILRCLAKSPADRFPSAGAFHAALEQVVLPSRWTARQSLAWWDEFDSRRAEDSPMPVIAEPMRGTITVVHRKA
jgi:serine/threonine-protein kinase